MSVKTMVVPFVPGVRENDRDHAKKVQTMLQQVISGAEKKGWVFDSVHTVFILSKPGCLAALFGSKTIQYPLNYVTFKKETDSVVVPSVASPKPPALPKPSAPPVSKDKN